MVFLVYDKIQARPRIGFTASLERDCQFAIKGNIILLEETDDPFFLLLNIRLSALLVMEKFLVIIPRRALIWGSFRDRLKSFLKIIFFIEK